MWDQIQRKLAEANLDLAGALKKAIAMEAAHSHSQVLKTPQLSVGKIEQSVQDRQPTGGGRSGLCHRCGLTGHHAGECRFRESICHRCSKRGHLSRVCHSATGTYRGGRRRSQQPQTPAAYQVEADPTTEAPEDTVDDFVNTVRKGAVNGLVATWLYTTSGVSLNHRAVVIV